MFFLLFPRPSYIIFLLHALLGKRKGRKEVSVLLLGFLSSFPPHMNIRRRPHFFIPAPSQQHSGLPLHPPPLCAYEERTQSLSFAPLYLRRSGVGKTSDPRKKSDLFSILAISITTFKLSQADILCDLQLSITGICAP